MPLSSGVRFHSRYYDKTYTDIEVIEPHGSLTGRGAILLEEYLYNSLDRKKHNKLINFKNVIKVDGLIINVLEYFVKRGMRIGLFNIETNIQTLLSLSGKENFFKTYYGVDSDSAVSLFEKEIHIKNDVTGNGIMGRRHPRINMSIQTEFEDSLVNNDLTSYKARILNLSEGGMLVNIISALNANTGKIMDITNIEGHELYNVKFDLKGNSETVVTNGKCVWNNNKKENPRAGIHFKDMKQINKKMIRNYVLSAGAEGTITV